MIITQEKHAKPHEIHMLGRCDTNEWQIILNKWKPMQTFIESLTKLRWRRWYNDWNTWLQYIKSMHEQQNTMKTIKTKENQCCFVDKNIIMLTDFQFNTHEIHMLGRCDNNEWITNHYDYSTKKPCKHSLKAWQNLDEVVDTTIETHDCNTWNQCLNNKTVWKQ